MPRKSLIDKILASKGYLKGTIEKHSKSRFLVVYDFSVKSSRKISHRFYRNLKILSEKTDDVIYVQKSVIECSRLSTAIAVVELAKHYGAKVNVYRVIEKIV
ncbi:MAG: hypothetical protein DRJ32_02570 [Thermoprotei archaeon]|nr:MAG: hypothetical protein B6U94_08035 [Thermofilum sp. ex4484_79]RLE60636.1 MAG: hypothetical protein DRJ32_02570 [Thermoprotei archaeon]